jgi:hypothetical protein
VGEVLKIVGQYPTKFSTANSTVTLCIPFASPKKSVWFYTVVWIRIRNNPNVLAVSEMKIFAKNQKSNT